MQRYMSTPNVVRQIEQSGRLMRPKTDSTNDPTEVTNNAKNTQDTNIYS